MSEQTNLGLCPICSAPLEESEIVINGKTEEKERIQIRCSQRSCPGNQDPSKMDEQRKATEAAHKRLQKVK